MSIPSQLMKLNAVKTLSGSCVGVTSVPFDWSKGFGDTWDTIKPNASGLTLAEIKKLLEDGSFGCPDPNPYAMTCEQLRELLEDGSFNPDVEFDANEQYTNKRRMSIEADLLSQVEREFEADDSFLPEWWDAYDEMVGDSNSFSPMMNYYYPIPGYRWDRFEDQRLLDMHGGSCVLVEVGDEVALALVGGWMDLREDICLSYMLLGYLPPLAYCDLPHFAGRTLDARMKWLLAGCLETCRRASRDAKSTAKKVRDYRKSL